MMDNIDATHLARAARAGGCAGGNAGTAAAAAGDGDAAAAAEAAEEGVQTFALKSNRRDPRPDQATPPLPLDDPRPACGCAMAVLPAQHRWAP